MGRTHPDRIHHFINIHAGFLGKTAPFHHKGDVHCPVRILQYFGHFGGIGITETGQRIFISPDHRTEKSFHGYRAFLIRTGKHPIKILDGINVFGTGHYPLIRMPDFDFINGKSSFGQRLFQQGTNYFLCGARRHSGFHQYQNIFFAI